MADRQALIDILQAEREAYARLLELLDREHEALLGADAEAVIAAAETKSVSIEALARLGAERRQRLTEAGFAADREGMTRWLVAHGGTDHPQLSRLWRDLLADAERARLRNTANGILVETRSRFNQATLSALRAAAEQSTLYGPDGNPDALPGSGRELGRA